jgi:hypothetical protein
MSKKYFALAFVLFSILTFCPNLFAAYPPIQNERLAMNAMRTVYNAQIQYQTSLGAGNFGSFANLRQANLIDELLASGEKYGYYFVLTKIDVSATTPARFFLTAVPRVYRKTGIRSFYTDVHCATRGADKSGGQAASNDPIVDACGNQNEMQAILALRNFHSAQMTYQTTVGNGNFGTLTNLYQAGLINSELASGHYRGYAFGITVTFQNPWQPAIYDSYAIPAVYRGTGVRSFYINQTGILRGADKNGSSADANDPPIESFTDGRNK